MTYQGYLLDLDGTIYRGKAIIPAGKRFVERLQAAKIPHLFVTNNSTKKPEVVQQRLAQEFGIETTAEHIYTASLATVDYLRATGRGNKVYAIGEAGLVDVLLEAGFEWSEEEPDFVVIGLDSEVSYAKLKSATLAIQRGALFIGTNPDKNLPTDEGLLPGAGAFLALIETATKKKPIIIGKPYAPIMEKAVARIGLTKEQVVMVGDNYETDIQAGIQNGLDTLLVLSGYTRPEEVPHLPVAPTHVVQSLDEWEI